VITPTLISQTYLDLADIMKLPTLKSNMTLIKIQGVHKAGFDKQPEITIQGKR
jgi:hypothetical protein